MTTAAAVLIALFTWWFSTGAILWFTGRRDRQNHTVWLSVVILVAGFWLVGLSAGHIGAKAAYLGFFGAILVWGWLEFTFLAGLITGPNKAPCPPNAKAWDRFLMAWGTIAHHELTLIAALIGICALSQGGSDQTALWTFIVLFAARISAKLNIFFGVPNLSADMLPQAVAHLKTYFKVGPPTLALPAAITVLSFANACWIERAIAAEDPTGFTLLAALTSLALLEHWLMVLPVRDSALWQWAKKQPTIKGLEVPDPLDLGRERHGL